MKLQEIIDEWKTDAKVDDLNIDQESARIPSLHAKYLEYLSHARAVLRGLRFQKAEANKKLRDYYLGLMTQQQLTEFGRAPFAERVLKNELHTFIESDSMMIAIDSKISVQEEKVEVLTEIMKSVNGRNFNLKNYIDWKRLTLGN